VSDLFIVSVLPKSASHLLTWGLPRNIISSAARALTECHPCLIYVLLVPLHPECRVLRFRATPCSLRARNCGRPLVNRKTRIRPFPACALGSSEVQSLGLGLPYYLPNSLELTGGLYVYHIPSILIQSCVGPCYTSVGCSTLSRYLGDLGLRSR
jgi:hypothetical protein